MIVAMPAVNPDILVWARETAGLTPAEAVMKVGIQAARGVAAIDRLTALERGDEKPTRRILVSMAHHYRRPLLAFYLSAPPRRDDRGPDFRTLPGPRSPETDALVNALVRNLRSRQNMVRAALEAEDEVEPPGFVGILMRNGIGGTGTESLRRILRRGPKAARLSQRASQAMAQVLGGDPDAASYHAQPNAEQAFRLLRSRTEDAGVFVLLKGDLGSHHTALDVETFRGLAIADEVAPFVVINDNDSRAAWSFTLLHELTHLLLGQDDFSDGSPGTGAEIEAFCDNVAAEWLLPAWMLKKIEIDQGQDVVEQKHHIGEFAGEHNLSRTLVAYRLLRANRIARATFERCRADFRLQWRQRRARERARARTSEGGPDYYAVRRHRLGGGVLRFTNRMVDSGALSTTKPPGSWASSPHRSARCFAPQGRWASRPKKQRANRHLPDACDDLGVRHCNTYRFIQELDFKTGRQR